MLYISKSPFLLYSIIPCSDAAFSNINLIGFAVPLVLVNFKKSVTLSEDISSKESGEAVPIPTFTLSSITTFPEPDCILNDPVLF